MWHYSRIQAELCLTVTSRHCGWLWIGNMDFTLSANLPPLSFTGMSLKIKCIYWSQPQGGSAVSLVFSKNSPWMWANLRAGIRIRKTAQMKWTGPLLSPPTPLLGEMTVEMSLKPLHFRTERHREVSLMCLLITWGSCLNTNPISFGVWDFAFLISFWMMLSLLVGGPHFE